MPSGNFGNLTGGLIAWKMGLPIHQYVAATNTNRVVPEYLETGHYVPRPSHQTLSNAMDVGNPSNFVRIQELFQQQLPALKQQIKGFSMNDNDTLATMKTVYERTGYLLDPHGAIGYAGSQAHKNGTDAQVFLETAHPAKFKTTVEQATGSEVPIPGRLKAMIDGPKRAHSLPADFDLFKGWLLAKKE